MLLGDLRMDVEIDYLRKRIPDPGSLIQVSLIGCTRFALQGQYDNAKFSTTLTEIAAMRPEILRASMMRRSARSIAKMAGGGGRRRAPRAALAHPDGYRTRVDEWVEGGLGVSETQKVKKNALRPTLSGGPGGRAPCSRTQPPLLHPPPPRRRRVEVAADHVEICHMDVAPPARTAASPATRKGEAGGVSAG